MSLNNSKRTRSTSTQNSEPDLAHETISPADIEMPASMRPVYVGSYSRVFRGRCRGRDVAIKVIAFAVKELSTMRRKVTRELEVWSHLDHPNIVPLYGYTDPGDEFGDFGAFVSPWYKCGDAASFLRHYGSLLTSDQRYNLWEGVISGVEYLHNYTPIIIHGDLKPSNILIDDEGNPRICDFGLCSIFLEEGHSGMTTTTEHTGTERYLAPELVTITDARPTTASDVYALGCVGLAFLFSQIPYSYLKNNRNGMIMLEIRSGVPPGIRPSYLPPETAYLWDVLEACWSWDSNRRPLAREMLLLREAVADEVANHVEIEDDQVQAVEEPRTAANTRGVVGRVLRDFQDSKVHGTLRLYRDEYIEQIERVNEDWFFGVAVSNKSRRGLFLDSCVELTEANQEPGQITPKVVEALRSYGGSSGISFSRGDRITNVSVTTLARWKGTANGRTGSFPAIYVRLVA